jgi:hypothetical protein
MFPHVTLTGKKMTPQIPHPQKPRNHSALVIAITTIIVMAIIAGFNFFDTKRNNKNQIEFETIIGLNPTQLETVEITGNIQFLFEDKDQEAKIFYQNNSQTGLGILCVKDTDNDVLANAVYPVYKPSRSSTSTKEIIYKNFALDELTQSATEFCKTNLL